MSTGIKVAFGGAGIKDGSHWASPEGLESLKSTLKKYNVKILDTAQLYGPSEAQIGSANLGNDFIIDTKWVGGFKQGSGTKENIAKTAKQSVDTLKVNKVDIFYLHAPDSSVDIASTLAGVNEAHQAGHFSRFGLSNYKAEDVQKVYDHCKENGYVLPSVYQGNYSPVARLQETLLFPTLRKLKMSFYAYSPLAGGFLTKTKQQFLDGAGRFDRSNGIGKMYADMYGGPSYIEALAKWEEIAKEAQCSKADLAYRWVTYNCPLKPELGDAIIVGARNVEQLSQTLEGIQAGPLSDSVVKKIDEIWESIKKEAPLDNFNNWAS